MLHPNIRLDWHPQRSWRNCLCHSLWVLLLWADHPPVYLHCGVAVSRHSTVRGADYNAASAVCCWSADWQSNCRRNSHPRVDLAAALLGSYGFGLHGTVSCRSASKSGPCMAREVLTQLLMQVIRVFRDGSTAAYLHTLGFYRYCSQYSWFCSNVCR